MIILENKLNTRKLECIVITNYIIYIPLNLIMPFVSYLLYQEI